jgi:hypothetical protein
MYKNLKLSCAGPDESQFPPALLEKDLDIIDCLFDNVQKRIQEYKEFSTKQKDEQSQAAQSSADTIPDVFDSLFL